MLDKFNYKFVLNLYLCDISIILSDTKELYAFRYYVRTYQIISVVLLYFKNETALGLLAIFTPFILFVWTFL